MNNKKTPKKKKKLVSMVLKTEPNWSVWSVQLETDYQSNLVKFPNLVETYQKLKIGGKSSFALGSVLKPYSCQ